jgi:hypothetical protein
MKQRKLGRYVWFCFLILIVLTAFSWQTSGSLRVSQETTRFVEPLRPDGTVDYRAVVEGWRARGVNAGNNAAAVFERLEVVNPSYLSERSDNEVVGTEVNENNRPIPFDYLINVYNSMFPPQPDDHDAFERRLEFSAALVNPWKSTDHADWAQVVNSQQQALDLVLEASHRSRCHFSSQPIEEAGGHRLLLSESIYSPALPVLRRAAINLQIRAMNRAGDGNIRGAIEDAKAVHRLALLGRQNGSVIDFLSAFAVEGIATDMVLELINHPAVAKNELIDIEGFLRRKRLDTVQLHEAIDRVDRCMELECFQEMSLQGRFRIFDINEIAVAYNESVDALVSALRIADPRRRLKEVARISELLEGYATGPSSIGLAFSNAATRGRWYGHRHAWLNLMSFHTVARFDIRREIVNNMMITAIALRSFQIEHGELPEFLEQLVPEYIDQIPEDWFSEEKIRYRRADDGCDLLYTGNGDHDSYRSGENGIRISCR